jgi:hypothetical protein
MLSLFIVDLFLCFEAVILYVKNTSIRLLLSLITGVEDNGYRFQTW